MLRLMYICTGSLETWLAAPSSDPQPHVNCTGSNPIGKLGPKWVRSASMGVVAVQTMTMQSQGVLLARNASLFLVCVRLYRSKNPRTAISAHCRRPCVSACPRTPHTHAHAHLLTHEIFVRTYTQMRHLLKSGYNALARQHPLQPITDRLQCLCCIICIMCFLRYAYYPYCGIVARSCVVASCIMNAADVHVSN